MQFEWDETKRRSNIRKHEIDFLDVGQVFDGRFYVDLDSSRRGEERFLRIAALEGRIIAVAWTWRGENLIRIISARRASDEEERAYRQVHG